MATDDAVLDFTFDSGLRQRVIVKDGEVYVASTYWHDGRKRKTVGGSTDAVTHVSLWDGTVMHEDLDGETVFFFPIPTLIELYPKDRASYENIRRKVLAANQGD
jgi:hypothetical protein